MFSHNVVGRKSDICFISEFHELCKVDYTEQVSPQIKIIIILSFM